LSIWAWRGRRRERAVRRPTIKKGKGKEGEARRGLANHGEELWIDFFGGVGVCGCLGHGWQRQEKDD